MPPTRRPLLATPRSNRRRPAAAIALGACFAALPACGKKTADVHVAPAASALSASPIDAGPTSWRFVVDPTSSTDIDMPGVTEHIHAETSGAAGELDVVGADLPRSRGLVRVDLTTLSTRTFAVADKDATQTKHAKTWLEAVIDGKTNDSFRWAEFAIRSIDGASATDLATVAPVKEGGDDVRTVTMTVHGDLLVHGHELPRDDVVAVAFHYPAGAPATSRPVRVEVTSKEPMRIVLKDFDVRPRDPAGKLLAWTTSLVSKVAETADVRVKLDATPGS